MLVHLTVRDFAIVDHLELSIQAGMTVMTGETGAGKSILVDALSLILGERSSSSMVRTGSGRAEVGAIFDISHQPTIQKWLQRQELDDDNESECILRRSVTADGRTRAQINGRPASIQTLRELGDQLVDIHGQHAHQSLIKSTIQMDIIDSYVGNSATRKRIAHIYSEWKKKNDEIALHIENSKDKDARLEWMRFQLEELKDLNLKQGEMDALDEEHQRLSHAAEITTACHTILDRIDGNSDQTAIIQIDTSLRLLDGIHGYDKRLKEIYTFFDTAVIHLKEGADALRQYINGLEVDEERLQQTESRLAVIHDIARKHRVQPEELTVLFDKLEKEINQIEYNASQFMALNQQRIELQKKYQTLALQLREARIRVGIEFANEVTANLQRLGMPGGKMEIQVLPLDENLLTPTGSDEIVFRISTNPGQPAKPLAQVASGGELSRIALAIQVIASTGTGIPTLIFDEVDAGIGGQVAEIVGKRLRQIGQTRQVLCITHLPQVASQANHHIKIQKHVDRNSTTTHLVSLVGKKRIQEIARMLGGVKITDRTLAHAQEMIDDNAGNR